MTKKTINFKVEGLNDLEELYKELFELREFIKEGFKGKTFYVSSRAYSTCHTWKLSDYVPVITTDSQDPVILSLEKRYSRMFVEISKLEEQRDELAKENIKLKKELNKKPWWKLG